MSDSIVDLKKKSKEDSKKISCLIKKSEKDSKKLKILEKKNIIENNKIKELQSKSKKESEKVKELKKENKKILREIKKLQKKATKISVEKSNFLITEFKKQTLTLSIAAFGFLAALTWRDAIGAWLAPLLQGREGIFEFTLIAIIVTIIAIVVPVFLTRFLSTGD